MKDEVYIDGWSEIVELIVCFVEQSKVGLINGVYALKNL